MSVSNKYIIDQIPVIASLLETAVGMVEQQIHGVSDKQMETPGKVYEKTLAPLPKDLIRDYVRSVGGNPSWYKGVVPPHLFPQWCFPLSTKTLKGVPYPLAKVLNGGCRLEINGELPMGEPLEATAQLTNIDDNGSRAVLTQKMTTGPKSNPEAITAYFYPIVPLSSGKKDGTKKKKEKATVPSDVRELTRWKIRKSDALDFAKLTGDFNPIHWIDGYAQAMGFRGVILHGFASMAYAIEGLNKNLFLGDRTRLKSIDCRFTRPLYLAADVGLYIDGKKNLYVGDRPGGPAYLTGSYTTR